MIRSVLRMGDPRLLKTSRLVTTFDTPELDALISDMMATMKDENGVGLAAPQIGVDLRVVIFGFESSSRYPDADVVPFTILVNPELTPLSEEMEEDWEGCLSVPGLRGWVPRFRSLKYAGYDARGTRIERTVEGFHARVVQHECDNLDGILYPMRVRDFTRFGFTEELFPGGSAGED